MRCQKFAVKDLSRLILAELLMIRKEEENVERKMSMWLNNEGVRAPCKIFAKVSYVTMFQ